MHIELIDHNPGVTTGGVARYVHELYQQLSAAVSVSWSYLVPVPGAQRLSFLRHLPRAVSPHQPGAIVHFTQIMGCALLLWRKLHPAVVTVHDLGALERPEEWQMFDPLGRQLLRLSLAGLRRADLIIADSEFTRGGLIKHRLAAPERIVTVPLAVDHAQFRPDPHAADQLLTDYPALAERKRPWLLYVGSELPRKNITTLLQAVARLKQRYPDLALLKVGAAGSEQFRAQTLSEIRARGLEQSVVLLDRVSNDDLARFYAAADLFIQPSLLEGFGLPPLEAMACGTPVVCSDIPALREVVDGAGELVDGRSAEALAQSVARVLDDAALAATMVGRGIERAQRFSWEHTRQRTLQAYDRCLDATRPAKEPR
jgi:glycosyltransferase involved in cell wall biosynthesis